MGENNDLLAALLRKKADTGPQRDAELLLEAAKALEEEEQPPVGTMPVIFDRKAGARISPSHGAEAVWWILRGIRSEKLANEVLIRVRALHELLPLISRFPR
jgi:hypothetical protein